MLSGVGICNLDADIHVVDKHDARLIAGERLANAVGVHGDLVAVFDLAVDGGGEIGVVGDKHAGGHDVVLSLGNQVVGDGDRISGVICENGNFGRASFGVDTDDRAAQAFGGGNEDVARTGDHVDRLEALIFIAVCEQCDGLCTADGPHLGHAKQLAGSQDGRVRPAVVVGLRRRGDDEGLHTSFLSWDDVHQHRRRVDGVAPGDVKTDARNRNPLLADNAAGKNFNSLVIRLLSSVERAHAPDGLLQSRADVVFQRSFRGIDNLRWNAHGCRTNTVKLLGVLHRRFHTTGCHVIDNGLDRGNHRINVCRTTRQHSTQSGGGGSLTAKINSGQHN